MVLREAVILSGIGIVVGLVCSLLSATSLQKIVV
jgi:ABC-type antimicrobial peptide transport system permease subunit